MFFETEKSKFVLPQIKRNLHHNKSKAIFFCDLATELKYRVLNLLLILSMKLGKKTQHPYPY